MSPATRAAVGLGSNLGKCEATLQSAVQALGALSDTRLEAVSALYRTAAWGIEDQPDFINAVALIQTTLAPLALLDALLAIEQAHGRQRSADAGGRWGPRVLDLDILLYGQDVIHTLRLQVPHPHLHRRAFALAPLVEVWPQAHIPGHGAAHAALQALDAAQRSGVVRV